MEAQDEVKYWDRLHIIADTGENIMNKKNSLQALCLLVLLKEAIQRNELEVLKSLVQLGINVNCEVYPGITCLMHCIDTDQPDLVKTAIELDADLNVKTIVAESAIHYAVEKEKYEALRSLLVNGKEKLNLNKLGSNGFAPIHTATKNGKLEAIKLLVQYGANVNLESDKGVSPLHYVATILDTV